MIYSQSKNTNRTDNVRLAKKLETENYNKLFEEKNKVFSDIHKLKPINRNNIITKLKKIFDLKYELSDDDYIIIIDKFHLERKVSKENIQELILFLDTQQEYRKKLFVQDKIAISNNQYLDNNLIIKQNTEYIDKKYVLENINAKVPDNIPIRDYKNMNMTYSPDIPGLLNNEPVRRDDHLSNLTSSNSEKPNMEVNEFNKLASTEYKEKSAINPLEVDYSNINVNDTPQSTNLNTHKILSLISQLNNNIKASNFNKEVTNNIPVEKITDIKYKLIVIDLLKNEINGKFIIQLKDLLPKYNSITFHSIHSNKTFIEKNNIHKHSLNFIEIENINNKNEYFADKEISRPDTSTSGSIKKNFFAYFTVNKTGHSYSFVNDDAFNGNLVTIPSDFTTLSILFYNSKFEKIQKYMYTDNDYLNIILKLVV
tara:strand:- start:385 stop:1662 length:1278 start_codon:yes stop_codon:yes gene_type:complete